MKPQGRRDQPDQRRPRIDFTPGEISVALKISFALVPPDAQPIIHGLQRKSECLPTLSIRSPPGALARDAQKIGNGAISGRQRRNLRVEMLGVEQGVDFCRLLENDRFSQRSGQLRYSLCFASLASGLR